MTKSNVVHSVQAKGIGRQQLQPEWEEFRHLKTLSPQALQLTIQGGRRTRRVLWNHACGMRHAGEVADIVAARVKHAKANRRIVTVELKVVQAGHSE